jgi:hypothetical protein
MTFPQKSSADESKIIRMLVTLLLIAATIFLSYFGLSHHQPVLGLLIPVVGIISFFLGRPGILLIAVFFVDYAQFKIPGLPKALGMVELSQALLVGWAVLDAAIIKQKPRFSHIPRQDFWMAVFGINLVLMMAVRGVGFARTGGTVYGGAEYIAMLITLFFYFAAVRVEWSDKNVKTMILFLLGGALIPMAAELIGSFIGGGTFFEKFLRVSSRMNELVEDPGEGIKRWSSFTRVAYMLVPIAFVFCKTIKWRVFLLGLALFLVGMTGFRSRMFQVGMLISMASIYYSKHRVRAFFLWGLAGLAGLGLLMIITPLLPFPVQRTLSIIPFLPVDSAVLIGAEQSANWRFDMWRDYCLPNVPKYLLIGRGLSPDISQYAWLQAKWYGTGEFYYYMGRYHSGPFSLLLDYGLLGTVSFTTFFLLAVADAWRTVRRYAAKGTDLVSKYYVYLTVWLSYEIFSFYFIFGDVRGGLFRLLILAVQLRILKKNFLNQPGTEMPEVGSQTTGVSPTTQQWTAGNRTSSNCWTVRRG